MHQKVLFILLIVALISIGAGIAWVHYNYLPSVAVSSPNVVTISTSSTLSATTTEAIAAIKALVRQSGISLSVVPMYHVLAPTVTADSSTFSYLGFIFRAPWKGTTSIKTAGTPPKVVIITFINGTRLVLLKRPVPDPSIIDKIDSLSSTINTEYDLQNAILSASPSQVISSTPADAAILTSALLLLKAVGSISTDLIYRFNIGPIKGFQYGDPSQTTTTIIQFFDQNDNGYNLTMTGTQSDVDYVLASLGTEK